MSKNTALATLASQWLRGQDLPNPTKKVCETALDCVGRLSWQNGTTTFPNLAPGMSLNTKKIGCVCYQAPVLWGYLGGTIDAAKASTFVKRAAKGNDEAIKFIYTRVKSHISRYKTGGSKPPAGAMVYHGQPHNPCAHVTMSVGNGWVVSTWAANLAAASIDGASGSGSPASKQTMKQITELMNKKLSPDTIVVPFDAFTKTGSPASIEFTDGPFWWYW